MSRCRTRYPATRLAHTALRHDVPHGFLALAAAGGHTELELQLVERIDTFRNGGADLPIGNRLADADDHGSCNSER